MQRLISFTWLYVGCLHVLAWQRRVHRWERRKETVLRTRMRDCEWQMWNDVARKWVRKDAPLVSDKGSLTHWIDYCRHCLEFCLLPVASACLIIKVSFERWTPCIECVLVVSLMCFSICTHGCSQIHNSYSFTFSAMLSQWLRSLVEQILVNVCIVVSELGSLLFSL
jgi:hypothetical protein